MNRRAIVALSTLTAMFLPAISLADSNGQVAEVVIRPKEYPYAFRNPLKGFLGKPGGAFCSAERIYVPWCRIEESAGDGVQKLVEYANKNWSGIEKQNAKIIPRVFLEWPKGPGGGEAEYAIFDSYWPRDMVVRDWESDTFKDRLVGMIRKMGAAWDNDPRVAFVEMGLIGVWGEQHHPFPSPGIQELAGDAFVASFKNKLIMASGGEPGRFVDYRFGLHIDCFGTGGQLGKHVTQLEGPLRDTWMYGPRGGEMTPNDPRFAGETGPIKTIVRDRGDSLVRLIRRWHWNMLGWIGFDPNDPVETANAQRVQKAFGYRFVVDEVRYPASVNPGGEFTVRFAVRNVGSAPFYYDWPVEVSLLDANTRQPVWKDTFKNLDIRTWRPGNFSDIGHGRAILDPSGKVRSFKWDTGIDYDIPAKPVEVTGRFALPDDLPAGQYIVALAILDPAGNLPSARLAIRNYFKGGRHPMGRIAVGVSRGSPELDEKEFDDLKADCSLHYLVKER